MRLLQRHDHGRLTLTTNYINEADMPPYAVLSHTWSPNHSEEVDYKDILQEKYKEKPGYDKILFCAEQAKHDGFGYFWIDTCCIDKDNPTELQEAINSMFRWYQKAKVCYVHMADVSCNEQGGFISSNWKLEFCAARWFTRGWTLQELIAPAVVKFFSSNGQKLGDKKSLSNLLHDITGVPKDVFLEGSLSNYDRKTRMSWAEQRETSRDEDKAYCLIGLLDVSMSMIYGEGQAKAFRHLEREIKEAEAAEASDSMEIPQRHLDETDANSAREKHASPKRQKPVIQRSATSQMPTPSSNATSLISGDGHDCWWLSIDGTYQDNNAKISAGSNIEVYPEAKGISPSTEIDLFTKFSITRNRILKKTNKRGKQKYFPEFDAQTIRPNSHQEQVPRREKRKRLLRTKATSV